MKKILSILLLAFAFTDAAGQNYQYITTRYEYDRAKVRTLFGLPQDTLSGAEAGSIAAKNGVVYLKKTYWEPVGGTIAVDTLYQDGLALKWVKGGVTYTLADAFKNLENSDLLLPTNRIIDLDGNALVFSDGSTHYDFDGSLMTLYIGDIDGNNTEVQQSSTNVNISATSPDDNAAFGFGANLITMGINGSDVSVTQDSIVSEHHIRAKTFQTETGKVKVLDGGVVVQDNTDVTVSYLLGKNVGGYVYDGFGINPADVVTFGLGGSIFMNALDSLRPYHKNNVGLTRKILLQGDAISSSDATKLNISDTAAMLLPWRNKADTAWSRNIMSAVFTGSATKTLTLTQRNGAQITASFTDSTGAASTPITAGYVAYGNSGGTGITGTAGNQYAETSTLSTLSLGNRTVGNVGLIDLYSSATVAGKISINNGLNLRHGTSAGSYIFVDNMSGGTGKLSNVSGESFPNSSTFGWTGNSVIRGVISSFINPATSSKLISGYTSSQNAAAIQSIGPMWMNPQAADPTSADGMFWSTTGGYFKGQIGGSVKNFFVGSAGTPTGTADASGTQGDIRYDDSYMYIKTSAGWKRTALSTF